MVRRHAVLLAVLLGIAALLLAGRLGLDADALFRKSSAAKEGSGSP